MGNQPIKARCQRCGYTNYIGYFGGMRHIERMPFSHLFPLDGASPIVGYPVRVDGVLAAVIVKEPVKQMFSLYTLGIAGMHFRQIKDAVEMISVAIGKAGSDPPKEYVMARNPEPIAPHVPTARKWKWSGKRNDEASTAEDCTGSEPVSSDCEDVETLVTL